MQSADAPRSSWPRANASCSTGVLRQASQIDGKQLDGRWFARYTALLGRCVAATDFDPGDSAQLRPRIVQNFDQKIEDSLIWLEILAVIWMIRKFGLGKTVSEWRSVMEGGHAAHTAVPNQLELLRPGDRLHFIKYAVINDFPRSVGVCLREM